MLAKIAAPTYAVASAVVAVGTVVGSCYTPFSHYGTLLHNTFFSWRSDSI
jgi:hypothetical protein